MWHLTDRNTLSPVLAFTVLCLGVCHLGQAITINSPEQSLEVSVEDDVLFSVAFTCLGTPTVQWTFLSAKVRRDVAVWKLGVYSNVSEHYTDRLHPHDNGSMTLLNARLADSGYYVLTVTEPSGNSKEAAIILTVTELLYEDLQYLAVFITVLGGLAGFLMLSMWFLHKVSLYMKEWCHKRELPEYIETELQSL